MSLKLSSEQAARIREIAETGYPHEVCGLLLGRFEADGTRRVLDVYPLDNERVDSRENRYAVSARSMLRAERHARTTGLDVVGYFHSHPNAPARPSAYDLEHATWPSVSYPIVSVVDGSAVDLASWELAEDRTAFEPEPLTVRDDAD